jgi:hypothetical protein
MNQTKQIETPGKGQHTPGPWYASEGSYHLGQRLEAISNIARAALALAEGGDK